MQIPIHQVVAVEEAMEEMKKSGVICPSDSPWSSPVVIVKKDRSGILLVYHFGVGPGQWV